MGESHKRQDELNMLIKNFERQLKSQSLEFYLIEQFEEIIQHYVDFGKNKMALKACVAAIEQYRKGISSPLELIYG